MDVSNEAHFQMLDSKIRMDDKREINEKHDRLCQFPTRCEYARKRLKMRI